MTEVRTKTILKETEEALALQKTTLQDASLWQLHNALGEATLRAIAEQWRADEAARGEGRQAAYLSAEYLIGRQIDNNLFCLGVQETLRKAGVRMNFEDIEDDAFGNGGLGRLAACYLDSAATHRIPLTGYGLRYKFGLFRQSFVDGRQVESPDDWSKYGDPWSVRRQDLAVTIAIKNNPVIAVPYDMPIIGYRGAIGTLRLWSTESPNEIDFAQFNEQRYASASAAKNRAEDIVKFLYPNDTLRAGKRMRIMQQYVLSSASMQDMLRAFEARYGRDYQKFSEMYAVQLNDTHPVMAIPELIRLLMLRDVSFEDAAQIAENTFCYTNHTVMPEALEKWDLPLLQSVQPELVSIIRRIDRRLHERHPNLHCVVNNQACMALLAVAMTQKTNGVAKIHSDLVRTRLFPEFAQAFPDRFANVTNGVTQRRWLALCNPELAQLIAERIGWDFLTKPETLIRLDAQIDDALADAFLAVKQQKKAQFAQAITRKEGIRLPETFLLDVQVKRLHEYKRQLLNIFTILALAFEIKDGHMPPFTPTVFLFGAKAAPGYRRAKSIIYFINQIASIINNDPELRGHMQVVFVQNYNCGYAESIIPAADLSEQISPAGTEASGTGNMKLMLNGALTVGTWDGANIEIAEAADPENNFLFGSRVEDLAAQAETYDPNAFLENDALIKRVVETLIDGTVPDPDGGLRELYDSLTVGASWHRPDPYYLLYDFRAYLNARMEALRVYNNPRAFARMCLKNIAHAGGFSSDRSVMEYAKNIWRL